MQVGPAVVDWYDDRQARRRRAHLVHLAMTALTLPLDSAGILSTRSTVTEISSPSVARSAPSSPRRDCSQSVSAA